jgi:hypothetical protein
MNLCSKISIDSLTDPEIRGDSIGRWTPSTHSETFALRCSWKIDCGSCNFGLLDSNNSILNSNAVPFISVGKYYLIIQVSKHVRTLKGVPLLRKYYHHRDYHLCLSPLTSASPSYAWSPCPEFWRRCQHHGSFCRRGQGGPLYYE